MDNNMKSVLSLEYLTFNNIEYKRDLTKKCDKPEYAMNFTRSISSVDDTHYTVSLSTHIQSKDDSIFADITLVGYFVCDCEDEDMKETLINNNTIAIMFPYLRSQITLLTTQPYLLPIVIPPLNIIELFKNADNTNQN